VKQGLLPGGVEALPHGIVGDDTVRLEEPDELPMR
jgi:hypothetical protein